MLVANELDAWLTPLSEQLVDRCTKEVPEYAGLQAGARDALFVRNVRHHLEVVRDVLRSMEPPSDSSISFAYRAAKERSEQGLSLASILRTYQIVSLGLWHWMTENPNLAANEHVVKSCWPIWLDYLDRATRAAADAYVVTERERVSADAASRRTFIEMLVSGQLSELETRRWLTSFQFGDAQDFIFVVIRWWDGAEFDVSEAVGLTAHAATQRLRARTGVTPIEAVLHKELTLLLPGNLISPLQVKDELTRTLAVQSRKKVSFSGAVSRVIHQANSLPAAHRHAMRVAAANRMSGSVTCVDEVGLFDHATAALRDDVVELIDPRLAAFLRRCAEDDRDTWIPTLEAWVANNLKARETAAALHVHPNSVYYRLNQLSELTGLDLNKFSDIVDLLTAVRLRHQLTSVT